MRLSVTRFRLTSVILAVAGIAVLLALLVLGRGGDHSASADVIRVTRELSGAAASPVDRLGPKVTLSPIAELASPSEELGDAVAVVGERYLSRAELDRVSAPAILQLRIQEYAIRLTLLHGAIERILVEKEAARRGTTVDDLMRNEVTLKADVVTDAEVVAARAVAAKASANVNGEHFAQIPLIELRQTRQKARRAAFMNELKKNADVRVLIGPLRFDVEAPGHEKRSTMAPVTIITFSNFSCAACGQAFKALDEVANRYESKVRIVLRHFPDSERTERLAEASECVAEQGLFSQLRDALFAEGTRSDEFEVHRLASQPSVNAARFAQCVESRKYRSAWERDKAAAEALGLSSRPVLFVNGRIIMGEPTTDDLISVIDDELRILSDGGIE